VAWITKARNIYYFLPVSTVNTVDLVALRSHCTGFTALAILDISTELHGCVRRYQLQSYRFQSVFVTLIGYPVPVSLFSL
jgi:hypothetical protein